MNARDRRVVASGPRSGASLATASKLTAILVAALLAALGTTAIATTPDPKSRLTPPYADTLRIGWDPGLVAGVPFAFYGFRDAIGYNWVNQVTLATLVNGALYRLDARFDAVPNLADGPCQPRGDGTVIRCHLVETTFHDGTPLTADDVAYSYQLGQETAVDIGYRRFMEEVRVVDPRSVDFVLPAVDPTFATIWLPWIPIFPRRAVEASYAAFLEGTDGLRADLVTELADAIDEELARDPPDCTTRLAEVEALLTRLSVHLYREDFSRGAAGTFDACSYLTTASASIRQAAVAMGLEGLDAVAAAFRLLSIDRHPIGAGPYQLVSENGERIHLEAWPDYHAGNAATRYVDLVPAKGDGTDLAAGTLDILQQADLGQVLEATAASRSVHIVTVPQPGFYALDFNVRPGQRFADLALRRALQLCIDLPRTVDAATGGTGVPVYGPVLPGSWADDPDLPKPPRDTTAARRLIERAGWTLGDDGVYLKNGARLGADIVVRANRTERVRMADLIVVQAADCGMELETRPLEWGDILSALLQYPHLIPGTDRPFELYLGGWSNEADPWDGFALFHSSSITDAAHPDGTKNVNIGGFADPVLDRLLDAAGATYDQAERAQLYREAQQEIATQVPMVFLWAAAGNDVVRSAVATTDGPLDLTVPNWAWQPERLVVEAAAQ